MSLDSHIYFAYIIIILKRYKAKRQLSNRPYFIIAAIFLIVLVAKAAIPSSSHVLGTTFLAKGDDSGGSSGSESSGSGGSGSSNESNKSGGDSSNSNSGSGSSDSETVRTQTRSVETGVRTQVETKQNETRTEVRLSEQERIRTRTKDGRTRIDITSGGIKTRLEIRDDRVVIKAEQEDGTEVELEDDAILKIDERLGASGIKVATASAGKFVLQRGTTGAVTNFPLSIDLATNTLSINTPSGVKTVAVLPDQAVQNLIAANVISRIGGSAIVDEVIKNNLSTISEIITLGERNGVPVYEINGVSDQKLLGFIPVQIQKTAAVSAQTGEVVSTDLSLGGRLLDLLSF